jgi:GrpB-like predicted nucleotidyltransferase (UPF0157 family)
MARHIVVVPYDPAWVDQAAVEMTRVRDALGKTLLTLHHIGSTAVPGLMAKPTLDLMGVVRDLVALEAHVPALIGLGYEPRGEAGIPGRRYFRIRRGDAHTHHLHLYASGHPAITRQLAFRDYLRSHPEDAEAYAALKAALAERYPTNSAAYTEGKSAFVAEILRRARGDQTGSD